MAFFYNTNNPLHPSPKNILHYTPTTNLFAIMPTAQTIAPTKNRPLYISHYPMYKGRYAKHAFWHVTKPATGDQPHREEIWFSMYREDVFSWSTPKRLSHKNSTICLINYDTTQNPPRLSFASIYLPPFKPGPGHASHPDYIPSYSLTDEQLHIDPTGLDIFNFYTNPNYFFTKEQHHCLSTAMLKRFSSDHPNYIAASNMWSSFNPCQPTQTEDWPTYPLLTHNIVGSINNQVNFGTPSQLPQQIIHTTQEQPYVVPNYPFAYGQYRSARFWLTSTPKTKTKMAREVAYCQIFNPITSQWEEPKAVSPAKATVCLFHVDKNPDSPTFGLPIFSSLNVSDYSCNPHSIFNFATNTNHYFTSSQMETLSNLLLSYYDFASPQIQQLNSAWANRPVVPPLTPQGITIPDPTPNNIN